MRPNGAKHRFNAARFKPNASEIRHSTEKVHIIWSANGMPRAGCHSALPHHRVGPGPSSGRATARISGEARPAAGWVELWRRYHGSAGPEGHNPASRRAPMALQACRPAPRPPVWASIITDLEQSCRFSMHHAVTRHRYFSSLCESCGFAFCDLGSTYGLGCQIAYSSQSIVRSRSSLLLFSVIKE